MARIIVVDDDPLVLAYVERCLKAAGHETRAVVSGSAALEIVGSWQPDLLITDINMPEMDGLELLRSVRSVSGIPVIAMSGGGLIPPEVLLANAGLMGAVSMLAKPFAASDVHEAVASALQEPGSDAGHGSEGP